MRSRPRVPNHFLACIYTPRMFGFVLLFSALSSCLFILSFHLEYSVFLAFDTSQFNTSSPTQILNQPRASFVPAMATVQMSTTTHGVEAIIGYNFNDPLILWEALQAASSSVSRAGTRRFPDGNKRLAVLGDAILKLVLVGEWYGSPDVRGLLAFSPTVITLAF